MILFGTADYEPLARRIGARRPEFSIGAVERRHFPDGETYLKIDHAGRLRDQAVGLVGGTHTDRATLELYDLACGIVQAGARSLRLVIPYFGYSTMERAVHPGEVVTAKTRARILSAIPRSPEGLQVTLVDLHSEGIPYYFDHDVLATHLYAKPVVLQALGELIGQYQGDNQSGPCILGAVDSGRAKWVESLANDLGVGAAFALKRRHSGSEVEVFSISHDVTGHSVIIYDDMIRTGGSLLEAARIYRAKGASRVAAVSTHGVLPGDSAEKIAESGLFDRIIVTDTHPRVFSQATLPPLFDVRSIAGLLADELVGRGAAPSGEQSAVKKGSSK